jgi:hypothetical protein
VPLHRRQLHAREGAGPAAHQRRRFHDGVGCAQIRRQRQPRVRGTLPSVFFCDIDRRYIEAQTVTGLADQYLLSWSYWMFKPYHDITTQAVDAEGNVLEGLYDSNGVLHEDKAFVLTRT